MKNQWLVAAAVVTVSLLSAPAFAQARGKFHEIPLIDSATTEAQYAGELKYITGGVGEDERAEIEATKPEYNLYVMNANSQSEFVEDTPTTIRRVNGKALEEVLSVEAGPLLFVSLPVGTYTVEATRHDVTKSQRIVIGKKTKFRTVNFGWKKQVAAAQ